LSVWQEQTRFVKSDMLCQKTLYWLTTAHVLSTIPVPKPTLIILCDSRTNKTRNCLFHYYIFRQANLTKFM